MLKLVLSRKSITTIETEIFKKTDNIKIINLGNNYISEIQDRAFLGLDKLNKLLLNNNNINKIKNTMFEGLTNLKLLDLGNNKINNLDNNTFEYLVNLDTLYLNNNNFSKIEQKMLNSLSYLRRLNLKSNHISEIGKHSFSALILLKTLYLSKNKLTSINNNTFFNLIKISELYISYNNIRYLDLNYFINTPKLTILEASNNKIISFSGNLLRLKSLQHLYLNNNSITSISGIGLGEYLYANNSIYLKHNHVNIGLDCENKWILENFQKRSFNLYSDNFTWTFSNEYKDNREGNIINSYCLFQYIDNKESCEYFIEIFNKYSILCNKGNLVYYKKYILLNTYKYFKFYKIFK